MSVEGRDVSGASRGRGGMRDMLGLQGERIAMQVL